MTTRFETGGDDQVDARLIECDCLINSGRRANGQYIGLPCSIQDRWRRDAKDKAEHRWAGCNKRIDLVFKIHAKAGLI